MIVNKKLPVGLAANATAVLGVSLGRMEKQILGPDCKDGSLNSHRGITRQAIPILGAAGSDLKTIYEKSIQTPGIKIIDFNTIAQNATQYDAYADRLSKTMTSELQFSGLCLQGPKKKINTLTGSLGLYR